MRPQPYIDLSDLILLELCIWREARGEELDGKRGVAHVILNRTKSACWWNHHRIDSISAVVLQPLQFSSFNRSDPQHDKWPAGDEPDFVECSSVATLVWLRRDPDNTDGATHYFDTSISWPLAWGEQSLYQNTLNVGRLRFWKLRQYGHDDVVDAITAD